MLHTVLLQLLIIGQNIVDQTVGGGGPKMGMGDHPAEAVEDAEWWGCHGPFPLQVRGPFGVRQPRKQAAWPNLKGSR